MATVKVKRAIPVDQEDLLSGLRREDAEEMRAAGFEPKDGIDYACRTSDPWVVRVDGRVMGMFGVARISLVPDVVMPWALTTTLVDERPKLFYRLSKVIFRALRVKHPNMINYVDHRYDKALRWARHLGFKISGQPEYLAPSGVPFYTISKGGL